MEISTKNIQLGLSMRHVGRLVTISRAFARAGYWSVLERAGVSSWLSSKEKLEVEALSKEEGSPILAEENASVFAPRLRRAFEELGPTFVKFGQMLAVREDLLPAAYIFELRKLHQHVAPISFADVSTALTAELGADKLKSIRSIEPKPLAAGSIAQVHRAELVTGEHVVLKVQRPHIAKDMHADLALMQILAGLIERYVPESRIFRPKASMDEFARAISGELDFIREGGNTAKMAQNFADRPDVVIPKVYWELCTQRVLTLEYIDGLTAWDKTSLLAGGFNPTELVERGVHMFLSMVFVDGLFHGDLHPGNLLALKGNKIGLVDFGVAIRLTRSTRERLAGLQIAIGQEDFESMCQYFVELASPGPEFDLDGFQHDIINAVAPYMGLRLGALNSGKLLWDLAKIAAKHGAPMPSELIVFMRTLASFEGIGLQLDPNFDLMGVAKKFTAQLAKDLYSTESLKQNALIIARDMATLARQAPFQMRRLLKAAVDGKLGVQVSSHDVAEVARAVDRASWRIAISIFASMVFISAVIIWAARRKV